MSGASYNRSKSEQVVSTPREFIMAVQKKFGRIKLDLAANAENSVTEGDFEGKFYGPGSVMGENSLVSDWSIKDCVRWLNPPFAAIALWAQKCSYFSDHRAWTLLLVPASIGTNWWMSHVDGKCMVYGLSPRITFVGSKDPYPKDLALCAYGYGAKGYSSWRWKA